MMNGRLNRTIQERPGWSKSIYGSYLFLLKSLHVGNYLPDLILI